MKTVNIDGQTWFVYRHGRADNPGVYTSVDILNGDGTEFMVVAKKEKQPEPSPLEKYVREEYSDHFDRCWLVAETTANWLVDAYCDELKKKGWYSEESFTVTTLKRLIGRK